MLLCYKFASNPKIVCSSFSVYITFVYELSETVMVGKWTENTKKTSYEQVGDELSQAQAQMASSFSFLNFAHNSVSVFRFHEEFY